MTTPLSSNDFVDDFRKVGPDSTVAFDNTHSSPTEHAGNENLNVSAKDDNAVDEDEDEDDLEEEDDDEDELEDDEDEEDVDQEDALENEDDDEDEEDADEEEQD